MARTEIKGTVIQDGSVTDVDIASDAAIQTYKIATGASAMFVSQTEKDFWNRTLEINEINELQNQLNDKASLNHTHTGYASSTHAHDINDINSLQVELDNRSLIDHTHNMSDILEANVIRVSKDGIGFNSIKAAIDSITDATNTNRYVILVGSGIFTEETLVLKPYITIRGSDYLSTVIQPLDPSQDLIIAAPSSSIFQCLLRGVTGIDKAAVRYTGGMGTFRMDGVRFGLNTHYAVMNSDNGICVSIITRSSAESDANAAIAFKFYNNEFATDMTSVVVEDFIVNNSTGELYDFMEVSGTKTQVLINQVTVIKNQFATTGDAFRLINGAELRLNNANISNFQNGLNVPNLGAGSLFSLSSFITRNTSNRDILILNPFTKGSIYGSLDSNKVEIAPEAKDITGNYSDPVNRKNVILGNMYLGSSAENITNISDVINDGFTMGIYSGGTLTKGGGFSTQISEGFGYLKSDSGKLVKTTWPNMNFSLSPNYTAYLYVNNAGSPMISGSYIENSESLIYFGKVITNDTDVTFIDSSPLKGKHYNNKIDEFNRSALGAIYANGSTVTVNGINQIKVTAGKYFYSSNKYTTTGLNYGISFNLFHRNGSGGYSKTNASQFTPSLYDNGSGTLQPIPVGKFVKNSLYTVGMGSDETYMFVYGQQLFNTLIEAEAGNIPTPPAYFTEGVVMIASIISDGVSTVEVRDERPVIGFKASGISSSATHGNLLGLDSDDHPQYFKKAGDTMTGTINMNNNPITNVSTLNGVNVSTHAARHIPNGGDPLPTGVAVGIGTNNSEGVANSFSRADHIHAHGAHSDPTNHAVATTSANGFMSNTDKTKLDGIATAATANATDAALRDRSTHTGTQAISTVTGLQTALDNAVTITGSQTITGNKTFSGGMTINSETDIYGNGQLFGTFYIQGAATLDNSLSVATTISEGGVSLTDKYAPTIHPHAAATTSANGFMSAADKTKLNGIATGANNYSHPTGFVNHPTTQLTGANIISQVQQDNEGHMTGVTTRVLTAADIGAAATSHTHSNATVSVAGFMSGADKTKLDGIATGANNYSHPTIGAINMSATGANVFASITSNADGHLTGFTTRALTAADIGAAATSHTHSNATVSVAGFMSNTDKTKLDGIATAATANATDAALRDRSTHTGTQAISTVTGLQTALDNPVQYKPKAQTYNTTTVAVNVSIVDIAIVNLLASTNTVIGATTLNGGDSFYEGRKLMIKFRQSTSGNGTVTWDNSFSFPNGTPPSLTSAGSKTDIFGFQYDSNTLKWQLIALTKNL